MSTSPSCAWGKLVQDGVYNTGSVLSLAERMYKQVGASEQSAVQWLGKGVGARCDQQQHIAMGGKLRALDGKVHR